MGMTIERGDYIVLRDNKKHNLARVTLADKSGGGKAVLANKKAASKETAEYVEFSAGDMVANLGPHPAHGLAYGVKVEPFYDAVDIEPFTVYYFRNLTAKERSRFEKHLRRVVDAMRKGRMLFDKDCDIIVRPGGGRMAGYYRHSAKKERPDELCIKPLEFNNTELPFLIFHEMAHGIWFTRLPPEWMAKWVKAYTRNISLSKIKSEQVAMMRTDLLDAGKVSQYNKALDDEGKALLKEILRYIKRTHSLQPRHLNMLIAGGDDLTEYWPQNRIDLQHKQVVVSEYAMTAPDEFFAEAFAFHMTEAKDLPKSVRKLMDKTLAAVKAGSTGADVTDDDAQADEDG